MTTIQTIATNQTMVKMILDRWYAHIKILNDVLNSLNDEQLQKEVSPGRNRATYILGHLIAVHDAMLPLLGFGEKFYPHLEELFITSPDKAIADVPSAAELRTYWNRLNDYLTEEINALQPEEWFTRHNAVSDEDFVKEPHRNKLNIILTRTTHMAYHSGQLRLIK
jgi:hypothetical protein